MNDTPFPPQDPNQPKPGQLGQPSPGQAPKPPKPPTQPWATGDMKTRWPWVVGGCFAAAILFLGIAANQHENTPTASETALASRTSAAAATLSAQQAEAKRLEQEEIKRQHEEERVRRAAEAEAERQRQAEVLAAKMDRGTYEQIGDRDFALLAKAPDAHRGRKLVIYGVVTQFDSATGKTTFRVETGANPGDYYDYDVNSMVGVLSTTAANVVEDDMVTLYVEVVGSYSYDTQIGGNTTVPKFFANIVDVTGSK